MPTKDQIRKMLHRDRYWIMVAILGVVTILTVLFPGVPSDRVIPAMPAPVTR